MFDEQKKCLTSKKKIDEQKKCLTSETMFDERKKFAIIDFWSWQKNGMRLFFDE